MILILFLLTALFATVAVTIAAGLAVAVVYQAIWNRTARRRISALNAEVFALSFDKGWLLAKEQERWNQEAQPLLYVHKSNAIH